MGRGNRGHREYDPSGQSKDAPDIRKGRETVMKKTLLVAGFAALLTSTAMAQDIGVSMARFDDNFLTVLRNGMIAQSEIGRAHV